MYSLDRSAFKIETFEEATKPKACWLNQPPKDRLLRAAWFLTCAASILITITHPD